MQAGLAAAAAENTRLSLPTARPLEAHWKPTARPLQAHWKPASSPLEAHCKPTASPLEVHWKPTAWPLEAHCTPTVHPLYAHWKPTESPLYAHWKPTGSPLQSHWKPTVRPLESHCKPTADPLQAELLSFHIPPFLPHACEITSLPSNKQGICDAGNAAAGWRRHAGPPERRSWTIFSSLDAFLPFLWQNRDWLFWNLGPSAES